MNPDDTRLSGYEAHYGEFCRESHLGIRSGMLRAWLVLFFSAAVFG